MGHVLSHAASLSGLIALLWVGGLAIDGLPLRCAGLGLPLRRLVLGLLLWLALLFALAAAGQLRTTPLLAAVVALVAGAVLRVLGAPRGSRLRLALACGSRKPATPRAVSCCDRCLLLLFVVTAAVVGAALFAAALSPQLFWDDAAYHLRLPKLYLEAGGFRRVPYNVYSHWPHAVDLFFALALWLHDFVLAKLVHLAFLAALVWSVFRFVARRYSRLWAAVAATLVAANPVVFFEATLAYVDIAGAFFFFLAFACTCEHLESNSERGARGALVLAGLGLGALAASKLTGIAGLACVGALVGLHGLRRGWPPRRLLVAESILAACAVGFALPWLIKSWSYTGNPVYPFFYETLGGIEWSSELQSEFAAWQRRIGMGRGLADYLLLPARVCLSGSTVPAGLGSFGHRLNPVWIVLVPAAIVAGLRDATIRRCLLVAGLYFVLWAASSQQTRFLVPILPLLAVSAAAAAARLELALREGSRRRRRAVQVVAAIGCVAVVVGEAWSTIGEAPGHLRRYLRHGAEVKAAVVPPELAVINRYTPKDARVLLVNTNQSFFLEREAIADSFFEASQVNALFRAAGSEEGMARLLVRERIGYVLWADLDWGISYPPWTLRFFHDPARVRLRYISPDKLHRVLEVRPRNSAGPP